MIHRDLKADNILLTRKDGQLRAKICDFGLHVKLNSQRVPTLRRRGSSVRKGMAFAVAGMDTTPAAAGAGGADGAAPLLEPPAAPLSAAGAEAATECLVDQDRRPQHPGEAGTAAVCGDGCGRCPGGPAPAHAASSSSGVRPGPHARAVTCGDGVQAPQAPLLPGSLPPPSAPSMAGVAPQARGGGGCSTVPDGGGNAAAAAADAGRHGQDAVMVRVSSSMPSPAGPGSEPRGCESAPMSGPNVVDDLSLHGGGDIDPVSRAAGMWTWGGRQLGMDHLG